MDVKATIENPYIGSGAFLIVEDLIDPIKDLIKEIYPIGDPEFPQVSIEDSI